MKNSTDPRRRRCRRRLGEEVLEKHATQPMHLKRFEKHCLYRTPNTLDERQHATRRIGGNRVYSRALPNDERRVPGGLVASKTVRRMITKRQISTLPLSRDRAKERRSPTHAPEGTAAPACSETEPLCHAQLSADWPGRGLPDS